jgi:hypothetical protein
VGRRTGPFDIKYCIGCGEKTPAGKITPANFELARKFGVRCEDCRRAYRVSIAERKRTVKLHRQQAAEFRARFEAEPYQSDLMVIDGDSASPTGCNDQLGRAPAHRRGRGC